MYKPGQWNAICDVCGFEFKSSELKKRWDGLMTCVEDFEHDHPQKYLRVHERSNTVPWVRDEPADVFIHTCYIFARAPYADLGEADCAVVGNTTFPYAFLYGLKYGTGVPNAAAPSAPPVSAVFTAWFVPQRG